MVLKVTEMVILISKMVPKRKLKIPKMLPKEKIMFTFLVPDK